MSEKYDIARSCSRRAHLAAPPDPADEVRQGGIRASSPCEPKLRVSN